MQKSRVSEGLKASYNGSNTTGIKPINKNSKKGHKIDSGQVVSSSWSCWEKNVFSQTCDYVTMRKFCSDRRQQFGRTDNNQISYRFQATTEHTSLQWNFWIKITKKGPQPIWTIPSGADALQTKDFMRPIKTVEQWRLRPDGATFVQCKQCILAALLPFAMEKLGKKRFIAWERCGPRPVSTAKNDGKSNRNRWESMGLPTDGGCSVYLQK